MTGLTRTPGNSRGGIRCLVDRSQPHCAPFQTQPSLVKRPSLVKSRLDNVTFYCSLLLHWSHIANFLVEWHYLRMPTPPTSYTLTLSAHDLPVILYTNTICVWQPPPLPPPWLIDIFERLRALSFSGTFPFNMKKETGNCWIGYNCLIILHNFKTFK
jgi:hypothetical protein